jgi:gamma-glutamyltranspeptidase/glutathione hydrolase
MLKRPTALVLLASLSLSACRPSATSPAPAPAPAAPQPQTDARYSGTFSGGFRFPEAREAAFGEQAMVASNSDLASQAGLEILRAGGNAMDAAVAVGFALAVTYPFAGNIGGGGFMVIRMADGRTAAIDYREIAPLAATRDMFVDASGKLTDKSVVGTPRVGRAGRGRRHGRRAAALRHDVARAGDGAGHPTRA